MGLASGQNFFGGVACTGRPIPTIAKFWSAPPLFLEDENIFQKSATLLVPPRIEFWIGPTWLIFELHRYKKVFFP
jgi:hypothetical protein